MEETPAVDWAALDKLPSGTWAPEVLRVRRELVEQFDTSQAAVAAVQAVATRDKRALAEFDAQLRPRIERRRKRLQRLFGGRIVTEDGQISIFSKTKVLDYDTKRAKELLAELKQRRVRKAIRTREEPDYEALKQMSPSFLRTLGHVGVTIGQMFYVSIKSTGEKEATNLLRKRREGK